jgi:hypothetical protein
MFEIMSFEPSIDHRTASAAGRAAAFPVFDEGTPQSGSLAKDRVMSQAIIINGWD